MIEQILIGSCEHQRYRRAAQLAMLEHFNYPVEIVDVIWAWHADFHDPSTYIDSLEKMGVGNYQHRYPRDKYPLSNADVKMRMLTRIVETEKNTIMIEDDHFLIIPRDELLEKLCNLFRRARTKVAVVQLYPRRRVIDHPVVPILGAEDFEHGCWGTGHHMLFVTPYGAEKLLECMREPKIPPSLENGMARYLNNKSWIYSVVPDQKGHFAQSLKCIQGESCGTLITKIGESIRRSDEQIKRELSIIEHFKL